MGSDLANIRFVADQARLTVGEIPEETSKTISELEKEYAPYLYDKNPPPEIIEKWAPFCSEFISHLDDIENIVAMYEDFDG